MIRYRLLKWSADGTGGWTSPVALDEAEDEAAMELAYRETLEDLSRNPPAERIRLEIVRVVRHRDYNPDKPG